MGRAEQAGLPQALQGSAHRRRSGARGGPAGGAAPTPGPPPGGSTWALAPRGFCGCLLSTGAGRRQGRGASGPGAWSCRQPHGGRGQGHKAGQRLLQGPQHSLRHGAGRANARPAGSPEPVPEGRMCDPSRTGPGLATWPPTLCAYAPARDSVSGPSDRWGRALPSLHPPRTPQQRAVSRPPLWGRLCFGDRRASLSLCPGGGSRTKGGTGAGAARGQHSPAR